MNVLASAGGPVFEVMVPGVPVPQGSKRLGVNRATGRAIVLDDNDGELRRWRSTVGLFINRCPVRFPKGVALGVDLSFRVVRPPSVRRELPAVLDALTDGGVYGDDGQVVEIAARKQYAEPGRAGCRIRVWEVKW